MNDAADRYWSWKVGLVLIPSVLVSFAVASTPGSDAALLGSAFAIGWAQLPGL
jgi:hypothetical protein